MKIRLFNIDGSTYFLDAVYDDAQCMYVMPKINYDTVRYIDFLYDAFSAQEGDDGFYLVPQGRLDEDSMLIYFSGHEGQNYKSELHIMPIYGARVSGESYLAVVTGMTYDYDLIAECVNGMYYLYPRFELNGTAPYEDIGVKIYEVDGEGFSNIAKRYRQYLFESGRCKPIRERENANLKYARESLYIRIRQCWKPAPSIVLEQTTENEPEVHIACDFDKVSELMKKCREKGIEKAEFCLVGWNISGHDGRWPQIMPPEPGLGGVEALKRLITTAKECGYMLSCHTNSTDAYSIADNWDEDILKVNKDGKIAKYGVWSGGQSYSVCPQKALEIAQNELPQVKALGFGGLHYIDVMSIVDPMDCYSREHPLNKRQAKNINLEIAGLAHELFGGFSSEGVFDSMAEKLDYGLYVSTGRYGVNNSPMCDETIPLWQVIYHGIILSNPYAETVNSYIKTEKDRLKAVELGARPTVYFYSRFIRDDNEQNMSDWMGEKDFVCDTDEQIEYTTDLLKKAYDDFKKRSYLQTEFIEEYEKVSQNIIRVTYSDRSVVTVDYDNMSYDITKKD